MTRIALTSHAIPQSLLRWLTWGGCLVVSLCHTVSTQSQEAQKASWIWGVPTAHAEADDGRCVFRHVFEIANDSPPITSAILKITADDQYVIRLNGRLVGVDADWNSIEQYDVSRLLKSGDNELIVVARNLQGAAGLMCQLDVTFDGAAALQVVTNDEWQARMQTSGTWDPNVEKAEDWSPAYVLGGENQPLPWLGRTHLASVIQRIESRESTQAGAFELRDGDRVLWLGNTLIEREQRYGYWETALTTRYPARNITFRNLGWSGDTVWGEARARFGTTQAGFEHLEVHVHAVHPTVIMVAYGTNESFAGSAGVPDFQAGLARLLDALESTGARVVVLSPVHQESLGDPLPDAAQRNADIDLYRDVMRSTAGERGHAFLDLGQLLDRPSPGEVMTRPFTDNGMHLPAFGYWNSAPLVERGLGIPALPWSVDIDSALGTYDAVGPSVADVKANAGQLMFTALDRTLPNPPNPTSPDKPVDATGDRNARHIRVRGLASGRYQLQIDQEPVASATAEAWNAGMTIDQGPDFAQVEQLRQTIVAKNELYFHRWRPQNETYLFLFRKHEQGNNAVEIPQFDPLVEALETRIAKLRHPVSRRYTLTKE